MRLLVLLCVVGLVVGGLDEQYIVVMKRELAETAYANHVAEFSQNMTVVAQHTIGKFRAYSAKISERVLPLITNHSAVAYVEQDGIARPMQSCGLQTGLPDGLWGLTRINQRARNLDGRFTYHETTGNSVRAYVLDTGVLITHEELVGRAVHGANFVGGIDTDDNGHGTLVSSKIAGRTFGVSRSTTIVSVKIINRNAGTSWTVVIQGIQWATADAAKHRSSNPSVGLLAVGGGRNQAVNDAVDASTREGLGWVVAAGNSNTDACNFSPGSAPSAFTVGGTVETDARMPQSNFGRCMSAFAPGANTLGAWFTSDTATSTVTGTSLAASHAAGVAAAVLATEPHNPPLTPTQLFAIMRASATQGVITDGKEEQGTPNLLVYSACNSS